MPPAFLTKWPGVVAEDVAFWGDMSLLPRFLKLLRKQFVKARVAFGEIGEPAADRKELARQLHAAVSQLHAMARTEPTVSSQSK